MRPPIRLTDHARDRLHERTTLSEDAFVALLARNRAVSVGHRWPPGHWHRLFYSVPDRLHFVAVQDLWNGEVITILPPEYHANLAWRIDEQEKWAAVMKATS